MLFESFAKQIIRNGSSRIYYEDGSITYRDFWERVQTLGNEILKHQGNGTKCAILCKNEMNTAIALFALFLSKVTAVPLSLRYGEKHCEKIIAHTRPYGVISDDDELNYKIVMPGIPKHEKVLKDVAAIMCTSGTTGNPKGVMLTYQNIWSNLTDILDYFKIGRDDKIIITRPIYHAAVMTGELLVSLYRGVDIVFYNYEFNPLKIIENIEKNNITVMCGTPTLFYYICNILKHREKAKALPLKIAVISGECMTPAVAGTINKFLPDIKIYNVYGLTEAAPRVSFLEPDYFSSIPFSVGVPLKSIKTKIVDPLGNEIPPGHIGELVVSGPNIMKGYYMDESATLKVLHSDWLYTGDLAYKDSRGFIYIRSRKDNMIIRAGMNIYPQEIENALKSDERIFDVLAFGVYDKTIGQKIYLRVATYLTQNEVFEICKKLLISFQLPDYIEVMPELARNASGKLIRL
ncbi:MAG: acyl--CoA ligase [Clostridiales bacterium]|nr:acyl--CoA ligase [Clostridiales bacterium]